MRWMFLLLSLMGFSAHAQELTHVGKIQGVKSSGLFDPNMLSPKSAAFSPDGKTLYVNALEAGKTLVYDFPSLKPKAVISHTFNSSAARLFNGQSTVFNYPFAREQNGKDPNVFTGKPVEMAFSHNGLYLWTPYYRRSNDPRSAGPSAVAIVDTKTNTIVRVLPTGPLPKYVAVAPDSSSVAVVQWGDNTIIKFDTSSANPNDWRAAQHWVVEQQLNVANIGGDRDKNCGYCLRGAVYTTDGQYLLVARMGGGGIAGFEVNTGKYLGTISNVAPTPRHLVMSHDGKTLWVSSNVSGVLSQLSVSDVLASLQQANGKRITGPKGKQLNVGGGARTVSVAPNEKFAYVATNSAQRLAVVDLNKWTVAQTIPATPFPVGLAVSPDGCYVVSTSQGRVGKGGGNTVDVFKVSQCQK